MIEFTLDDKRHLEAAKGWLGLGSWQEAHKELDDISPHLKQHPEVLAVQFEV